MKRRISILAMMALAIAASAEGATSPLGSAADYIFSTPGTNVVYGVVMGPGGDYGTMRAEDVAYLREAFNERAAVLAGADSIIWDDPAVSHEWTFGSWAQPDGGEEALIWRGTNEIVGRLVAVTNKTTHFRSGSAYPAMDRYYSPREIAPPATIGAWRQMQGVWYYQPRDNYYSPANAYRTTPFAVTNSADAWQELCTSGGIPCAPAYLMPETTNSSYRIAIAGPALKSTITNLYALAAEHRQAGFGSCGSPAAEGNDYYKYPISGEIVTNAPGATLYYRFSASPQETVIRQWTRASVSDDFGTPVETRRPSTSWDETWQDGPIVVDLPTAWLHATTGGVMRLVSGTVYVAAQCSETVNDYDGATNIVASVADTIVISYPATAFRETNGIVRVQFSTATSRTIGQSALAQSAAVWTSPEGVDTSGLTVVPPELTDDDRQGDKLEIIKQSYVRRDVDAAVSFSTPFVLVDCTFRTEIQQ